MTGRGPLTGRIAGQLALLVVAAIVVTHVVVTVAFLLLRPELRRSEERPSALANRLVTVVHMVAAGPARGSGRRGGGGPPQRVGAAPDPAARQRAECPAPVGRRRAGDHRLRAALGPGYGLAADHLPAGALHLRIAGPGGAPAHRRPAAPCPAAARR